MFAVRPMFSSGGIVNPLPGGTFQQIQIDPNDASITLSFLTDGRVTITGSADHLWFNPQTSGIGSSYWIRATLTSGTAPSSGTLNTWLQLSSNRSWNNTQTTVGEKTSTFLIEIATDSGGTNIVTSGTYTITATVEV